MLKKQTSQKGSVIYEEVLQKNFEVIETFLKKFHHIFTKQDRFEETLKQFAEKFNEFDELFEEFRDEQRMSISAFEKKLGNMKSFVRESNRKSKRFSKLHTPNCEATQGTEQLDLTSLKCDFLENQSEIPQGMTSFIEKKIIEETSSIVEGKAILQEQLDSLKKQVEFFSAYMASSEHRGNGQSQLLEQIRTVGDLEKKIQQCLGKNSKSLIEDQIERGIVEVEKILMQHIDSKSGRLHCILEEAFEDHHELLQKEIQNLQAVTVSNQRFDSIHLNIQSDLRKMSQEVTETFANKQEVRRQITFIEKKLNKVHHQLKEEINFADENKQSKEYLQSMIKVNNYSSTPNSEVKETQRESALQKKAFTPSKVKRGSKQEETFFHCKRGPNTSAHCRPETSHPQLCRKKLINTQEDEQKENLGYDLQMRKSSGYKNLELSQGCLYTSKVSKDFMKNFGLKKDCKVQRTLLDKSKKRQIFSRQTHSHPQKVTQHL